MVKYLSTNRLVPTHNPMVHLFYSWDGRPSRVGTSLCLSMLLVGTRWYWTLRQSPHETRLFISPPTN